MADTTDATNRNLTLPEELVLVLLNEENGYFHHVPGWDLNCAVIGAVLAELSLLSRIDTTLNSLTLEDSTETGDPALDPILKEIAAEPTQRNAQYWIERLAVHAESIIDLTLDRLVELNILKHHDGEFWTLVPTNRYGDSKKGSTGQFIKGRISEIIFTDEIPTARDIIIICLVNTCDVFRFMFELDDEATERINFICQLDLIGRSIANAVKTSSPLLRRSGLRKKIPRVVRHRLLFNPHFRSGNIPALFADLTKEYGPVFQIRRLFGKPMTFLAGADANRWAHRQGRLYLRTSYLSDFEKLYGSFGMLPSLDGGDHFKLRRSLSPAYSRGRLTDQLDEAYKLIRKYMANWVVGQSYDARSLCRRMANSQLSPLLLGIDTQDLLDDMLTYKERALTTHVLKTLPKFTLRTPGMKRRAKAVDKLMERVRVAYTPAQRMGCPRNLVDDTLSLHASDPHLVPETSVRLFLSMSMMANVYMGDMIGFAIYTMVSRPELYEKIRSEADALFDKGDPTGEDFSPSAMDVTDRFLKECLRMHPVIPMSMRDVMNSCVVEGHQIPVGSQVFIAQTATHYMEEFFPDPFSFDIDRYKSPREEHRGVEYAPYGLGTHKCLGKQWMILQLAINVLMIARYFTIELSPADYKLQIRPFPSLQLKNLKFRITEQKHKLELPV